MWGKWEAKLRQRHENHRGRLARFHMEEYKRGLVVDIRTGKMSHREPCSDHLGNNHIYMEYTLEHSLL